MKGGDFLKAVIKLLNVEGRKKPRSFIERLIRLTDACGVVIATIPVGAVWNERSVALPRPSEGEVVLD